MHFNVEMTYLESLNSLISQNLQVKMPTVLYRNNLLFHKTNCKLSKNIVRQSMLYLIVEI